MRKYEVLDEVTWPVRKWHDIILVTSASVSPTRTVIKIIETGS